MKVGFLGKTGSGKSSLLNKLTGEYKSAISHTGAKTTKIVSSQLMMNSRTIQLLDFPGLGENLSTNPVYLAEYIANVPQLDIQFWCIKADDRVYSDLQDFFETLLKLETYSVKNCVFLFTRSDQIEPSSTFNRAEGTLSDQQRITLERKKESFFDTMSEIVDLGNCPYYYISSKYDIGMVDLFTLLEGYET